MKILIGCEESQTVCEAFLDRGHDVYSCDILPSSGKYKDRHIQGDIFHVLHSTRFSIGLDLFIGFPPCTDLAVSGARYFKEKQADGRQQKSIRFFISLANVNCGKVCLENPIGIMSTHFRKPDQIIQPWQYGHGETKATCLWLKGLPKLIPTDIVEGREQRIWKMAPSPDRAKNRSKTYQGIAKAMAEQWG